MNWRHPNTCLNTVGVNVYIKRHYITTKVKAQDCTKKVLTWGGGSFYEGKKPSKAINTLLCSKLSTTRVGSKAFKGKHRTGGRVHFNLSINYSSKFSLCTLNDAPITRIYR